MTWVTSHTTVQPHGLYHGRNEWRVRNHPPPATPLTWLKFGYKQSLETAHRTIRVVRRGVRVRVDRHRHLHHLWAVLNSSGPVGIWTWPIAAVGQLAVAFVLGALAARIPVTGYHYQWMSRLANPVLGWILGWISFTFLAIVVVAVDYTIASTIFPVLLNYEGTATIAWLVTAHRAADPGAAGGLLDTVGGTGEQHLRLARTRSAW